LPHAAGAGCRLLLCCSLLLWLLRDELLQLRELLQQQDRCPAVPLRLLLLLLTLKPCSTGMTGPST
jgi:hypothetical protein